MNSILKFNKAKLLKDLDANIQLDRQVINSLIDMDTTLELVDSLFEILNLQSTSFNNILKDQISEENFNFLSKEAHKLKSSFGSLGLTKLQYICKNIELECKKNKEEVDAKFLFDLNEAIENCYPSSMNELKEYINGFKSKEKNS